jgi:hypothetical protein
MPWIRLKTKKPLITPALADALKQSLGASVPRTRTNLKDGFDRPQVDEFSEVTCKRVVMNFWIHDFTLETKPSGDHTFFGKSGRAW